MTQQPNYTDPVVINAKALDNAEDPTSALLVWNDQQAVLPRRLEEGIYAVLNADGAVQVVETPGYEQGRERDWERATADGPHDIHRNVVVQDVPSFLAYLFANTVHFDVDELAKVGATEVGPSTGYAHGKGGLEVWADIDQRKVTGILDGHTGWRKHTCTLQLKLSREWAEWAAIDGKLLKQAEFAQFIEDHLSTIAEPDGAKLLDICQTLQANTSVQFKSQTILANGQRQLRYEETVEAKAGQKGDLTIPGELTLVLRPFQGSAGVPITARFRFQIRDGVLTMGVKLAEPDTALEDAFNAIVRQVADGVPVPVLHGRP